ncbi:TonB-dependent receptor [uncultured Bacteroides sp.]|uniref:SusC/RagA family TonB-linked outer membrane protein n=1 Tax=uncultured Bacteroides sp. TaxID=162156 RepID=UPI0025D88A62|nr:TonB-dependent receptor [uncultured Bacteroides sp.]
MKLHKKSCTQWQWAKLKQLFAIVMFSLVTIPMYGQNRTISGTVKSEADDELLIGVSVKVKEAPGGTITDAQGRYTLQAKSGQTLVFSYIGFRTLEVKIDKQKSIDVSLREDTKMLDEVVVVGYGTMKRSDLTGSVVSVSADDIKKTVVTSLDQALQGRAAGVSVTQNSGAPGGGISVSIRGINSLNGNEPLYVIDGVAISGQTGNNSSVLSSINPSDIVSMEILKDASATAIYGSRASNGVVLITTRQGEAGKTRLSYEGYVGVQQLPNRLDVLNLREYAEYQNLRAEVLGWGAREEFKDPSLLGEGTNWQKEIFRSALMHNHQINITGGNENAKFSLTGGYLNQDGIAIGSSFERFSVRMNADAKITKWLTIGLRASGSRTQQVNTVDNGDIISTAIRQLPEVPAKNPDGSWGTQQENIYGTYFSNPVAEALMRENYDKGTQLYVNLFADINIWKGLSFHTEYGGSYNYNNHYQFTPSYDYGLYNQQSSSSRNASNGSNYSFKNYFTYNAKFGKHDFSLMAGHEAQENTWENLSGSRSDFFLNSVHELDAGDALTAKNGSSKSSGAIESYFGRFNYSFDDRYLLTATLRSDGSSNFGPNNRWGTFPSVAVAWKIKNEAFLKNVTAIDNLKLRFGWGAVGNQSAGSYAYGVAMASAASIWGTGFYAGNYANANLKWEETQAYNIGLDVNLLGNRIEFIAEAYYKNTDNLLMQAALPDYVNSIIRAPWVNAGAMVNKGMEFTLNTVNIDNRDFFWKTGITLSFNKNEVTRLYTETAGIQGYVGSETYTYSLVGEPVGQFYGYKVIGMFKDEGDFYQKDSKGEFRLNEKGERIPVALPKGKSMKENEIWVGDYIFEDKDNNGVIDEKDRSFLGNPEPKFNYGINNYFSYKGFDLNIFINGVYGNKIFNSLRKWYTNPMNNSGMLKETIGIARVELIDPEGPADISNVRVSNPAQAKVQRITANDANDNNRMSDRFIEDGSYLRIKNISLGYTFPRSWLEKIGIENLRIYANVQNAFTFTKYKGYDPEIGAYNQNVLTRGIDNARYPSQRIYTFGLNLGF